MTTAYQHIYAIFNNRQDAAEQLAQRLQKYRNTNGVVLAIPRGGVPIGAVVAQKLNLPLDIALSKKIGHPYHPEYAIGAVSLNGSTINPGNSDVPPSYIQEQVKHLSESLKQKYRLFKGETKPIDLRNKTVIITDDGIATGSTVLLTIKMVRSQQPALIVVAVPVSPMEAGRTLMREADEVIILTMPTHFLGVGQFYRDFSQVTDEEVIQLMKTSRQF